MSEAFHFLNEIMSTFYRKKYLTDRDFLFKLIPKPNNNQLPLQIFYKIIYKKTGSEAHRCLLPANLAIS